LFSGKSSAKDALISALSIESKISIAAKEIITGKYVVMI
jgi:hypothetical protein